MIRIIFIRNEKYDEIFIDYESSYSSTFWNQTECNFSFFFFCFFRFSLNCSWIFSLISFYALDTNSNVCVCVCLSHDFSLSSLFLLMYFIFRFVSFFCNQIKKKQIQDTHTYLSISFFNQKKAKFVFFQNWFWWKRFRRKNIETKSKN